MRVEIDNNKTQELLQKFQRLSLFAQKEVKEIMNETAEEAVDWMKQQVPQPPPHPDADYPTGNLQSNIRARVTTTGTQIKSEAYGKSFVTGKREEYAHKIEEYGGRNNKGKHYFRLGTRLWFSEFRSRIRDKFGIVLGKKADVGPIKGILGKK